MRFALFRPDFFTLMIIVGSGKGGKEKDFDLDCTVLGSHFYMPPRVMNNRIDSSGGHELFSCGRGGLAVHQAYINAERAQPLKYTRLASVRRVCGINGM